MSRPASTDLPIFSLSSSGGNYPLMTTSASLNLPLTSRWDYGAGALDRAKGNKRNWILVWEDGFSDFYKCEKAGNIKGRFGADVFFKMSHEVYSYSEGMVGKVAAYNSHKWVFKDNPSENDSSFITSWNVSIDPVREFHTFLEENLCVCVS